MQAKIKCDNMDMDRKQFATRLGQLREIKGFSAYELSQRIGKSLNYIHMVENGKVNISLDVIFDIARELEIKPGELFAE